jgi:hypothetical protein
MVTYGFVAVIVLLVLLVGGRVVAGALRQKRVAGRNIFCPSGEEPPPEEADRLFFGWKQEVQRYHCIALGCSHTLQ